MVTSSKWESLVEIRTRLGLSHDTALEAIRKELKDRTATTRLLDCGADCWVPVFRNKSFCRKAQK